mmetsp:Transcript_5968/g.11278  ORF Transcript_5968/g.11278 Transcript_5968/m.11278 type:complete len:105 (-) Transcript_5968:1452-1766(-)
MEINSKTSGRQLLLIRRDARKKLRNNNLIIFPALLYFLDTPTVFYHINHHHHYCFFEPGTAETFDVHYCSGVIALKILRSSSCVHMKTIYGRLRVRMNQFKFLF